MFSILLLGATALLTALTGAIPSGDTVATADGGELPISDQITWIGSKERGGENHTFTGTRQEVLTKIQELEPYWMREKLFERSESSTIIQRDPISGIHCKLPYIPANSYELEVGWQYINSHFGDGYCATPRKMCERFSCSQNAAILMCNNANTEAVVKCHTLADEAQAIWAKCSNKGAKRLMAGQQFYNKPAHNVLLKGTNSGNGC